MQVQRYGQSPAGAKPPRRSLLSAAPPPRAPHGEVPPDSRTPTDSQPTTVPPPPATQAPPPPPPPASGGMMQILPTGSAPRPAAPPPPAPPAPPASQTPAPTPPLVQAPGAGLPGAPAVPSWAAPPAAQQTPVPGPPDAPQRAVAPLGAGVGAAKPPAPGGPTNDDYAAAIGDLFKKGTGPGLRPITDGPAGGGNSGITTPGGPSGPRFPGAEKAADDAAMAGIDVDMIREMMKGSNLKQDMGDPTPRDPGAGVVTVDDFTGDRPVTADGMGTEADSLEAEGGPGGQLTADSVGGPGGDRDADPPTPEPVPTPAPSPTPTPTPTPGEEQTWYTPDPDDPWASWFNEDGVLSNFGVQMTTEQMNDFLVGTGISKYPKSEKLFRDIMQSLSSYAGLESHTGAQAKAIRDKINQQINKFNEKGWVKQGEGKPLDYQTMIDAALTGGGGWGADPGGGGGGNPPPTDPPHEVELVEPPNYNYEKPDEWIKKLFGEHPDAAKLAELVLNWDAMKLSRDDRQLAIDEFMRGNEGLLDSERRRMLDEFITAGPNETYSADDIAKMKAANAEGYGDDVEMMDANLKEYAAALGVDPSSLAGIGVAERARAGRGLTAADRGIDLEAARTRAQDRDRWFSQSLSAEGALTGTESQYYQQLAALLAGTPGLIQSGNPLAGLADYQIYDNMLSAGPGEAEKVGGYIQAGGAAIGGLASLASLGI